MDSRRSQSQPNLHRTKHHERSVFDVVRSSRIVLLHLRKVHVLCTPQQDVNHLLNRLHSDAIRWVLRYNLRSNPLPQGYQQVRYQQPQIMTRNEMLRIAYSNLERESSEVQSLLRKEPTYKKRLMNHLKSSSDISEAVRLLGTKTKEELKNIL